MANDDAPRAEILRSRDFIGWAVSSANGANVGTVSDILIDRTGRVRFLAVDPGIFKKPYLLPVEALEWGEGSLQASWTDADVKRLPPYDPGVPLTATVLEELGRAYPRHYGSRIGDALEPGDGARVVPLRDAKDFRLAKGAPNLKGWTVYASDNEKVGVVTQMLVDPLAMKVRYIDVDLADDLFGLTDDRHVLVPLEAVELRERSEDVWVQGMAGRDIAALPAYLGGPVDPLLEEGVESAFNTSYARLGGAGDRGQGTGDSLRNAVDDDRDALPPPERAQPPAIPDAEFAQPPVTRPPAVYRDEPPPLDLDSSDRPPSMDDDAWREDEPRR
jgi:sporulation protein YlmC with PRC-barrel domain